MPNKKNLPDSSVKSELIFYLMCFKTENDVANQLPLLIFSNCWYHWVQPGVHISEF